jgi:acyl-CoA oxidase
MALSKTSGGTGHILPAERAKASFSSRTLTETIWGGKEALAQREKWLALFDAHPDFDNKDDAFHDRAEVVRTYIKRFFTSYKIVKDNKDLLNSHSPVHGDGKTSITGLSGNSGGFTDHFGLFLGTILMQATPAQQKEWVKRAMNLEIVGTYAQTELGHGSNVRGLETTAEYDAKTDTFVVDSPTLTSMKWWPGALGMLATHAIIYARLIIEGKDYGYHAFMVQLRDEHHKTLPGIECGDIGPKMGYNYYDSGYCSLTKARIPRTNMLMRFQQVEKGGKYVGTPKGLDKIAYMTMTKTRVIIAKGCAFQLAKATTIAIRYNAVRRQGFIDSKQGIAGGERATLDYRIQQYRMFPHVATAHAITFASKQLDALMDKVDAAISAKTIDPDSLTALHITSAALKAFCTQLSCQGIEEVRQCCGGQGYTMSSGIAGILMNHLPSITYEGDIIPMALQVARFLVGTYVNYRKGKKVAADNQASYICQGSATALPKDAAGLRNIATLVKVWKSIAQRAVTNAAMALQAATKATKTSGDAWNAAQVSLVRAAYAHALTTLVTGFADAIPTIADPALRKVEERLCVLFALTRLDNMSVAETCLTQPQALAANEMVNTLLAEIRPDAVALADGFGFTDRQLNSCIGRYDGNVYEAVVDWSRRSPLNHDQQLIGDIKKYLDPFLDKEYLKAGKAKL